MRFLALWLLVAASVGAQTFQDLQSQATAARDANKIPQAIDLYRKAVVLNPQWEEGWWFLGTLQYDTDQFAPAREAFQHFVTLDAKAAPGWAFLGLCEFETRDYAKALDDIERGLSMGAAKEEQMAPVLLYHEALLLTKEKQFDKALQKYTALVRGMQGRSVNESMLISVGLAALRRPLVPDEVSAEDKQLCVSAGRTAAFALAGDYAQADAAFDELLRAHPKTPDVHYMHGIYLLARNPDEAFEEFKREIEIAPTNTSADAMLAFGLLTRGDSEEALPYAQKAFHGDSGTAFNRYLLGRALAETGAIDRGLSYLEEAEKADNSNVDVHVALAAGYSRIGKPIEARRERELAMQMESENRPVVQP